MRRHIRASLVLLSSSLLLACDPAAQQVGEGLPTDDGASAWAPAWRVQSDVETMLFAVAATDDGGVVVTEYDSDWGTSVIRRYSADGTDVSVGEPLPSRLHSLVPWQAALFVTGASYRATAPDGGSRATVWRLSAANTVDATYVHPRVGTSNAFAFDVAVTTEEVAFVVGNGGGGENTDPDESWFEVVRLTHDLQPLGDPVGFDAPIEQVAYDASGALWALELPEQGLARLHRIGTDADPLAVDCQTLLVDGGPVACTTSGADFQITDVETGGVLDLGSLGLGHFARAVRRTSTVYAGTIDTDQLLRVVEVRDDMTTTTADIPMEAPAEHVLATQISQGADGSVYIITTEILSESACEGGSSCLRGQLYRLPPTP